MSAMQRGATSSALVREGRQEIAAPIVPGFLRGVPPRDAQAVLTAAALVRVPAGAIVLQPGENRLWLVVEGLVRLFMITADGRQLILLHAVPGETIGLASLFTGDGRVCAQTVVESRLLSLDWARVRTLLRTNPVVNEAAASEVIERTTRTLEAVSMRSIRTVLERIAGYVLELVSRTPGADPHLPLTHQELADAVGCSREAVSRSLGELRRRGLVGTAPALLTVLDPDGLRREARRYAVKHQLEAV